MASSLRTKRYRRFLFTEDELKRVGDGLYATLSAVESSWRDKIYPEPECVAQYILEFLKIMRPKDYLGGPHSQLLSANIFGRSVYGDASVSNSAYHSVAIFAKHSIRSVPLAVNRALVGWAEGRYKLHLIDYIPDARSILETQAQGERVVTCFFKKNELSHWVEGKRDPLGFVLHDLIHADHFFHDEELAKEQTKFYGDMLTRLDRGEFSCLLECDAEFSQQFEYIISDMNSHPKHLEQTLQAVISIAEKKLLTKTENLS